MVDVDRRARRSGLVVHAILMAMIVPGCAMVPHSRLDDSQRLTKNLRAENARLQDQVVGLQAQNRDAADRAMDDLRRLTARDEAIEHLERSVQAYQDDRDRLAAAYERLAASLGRPSDVALEPTKRPGQAEPLADR